jgi:hypothetical protein
MGQQMCAVIVICDDHVNDGKIDQSILDCLRGYGLAFDNEGVDHSRGAVEGTICSSMAHGLKHLSGVSYVRESQTWFAERERECQ